MPDLLSCLLYLGRPLSPFYSLFMRARARLYLSDLGRREKMDVPVVSVGNLTKGGTGKTPIVRYIARLLVTNGYKPAIISRGYGGAAKDKVNIVSDGETLFLDSRLAGDEPRLLA